MNLFPFVAVVGMEMAKKSLLYHAIDPRIGGTLFLGHRGCAKSTLVRGFAEILTAATGHAPFVEMPLGASEDRVVGSVNAGVLVEQGKWLGQAGLIEEANGGVLYIDEVNLLPDNLADLILDSAASGQHRTERDGITRRVVSQYTLVGTMNPEEGDLRPQLLDRFAHGVKISDDFSPEERMEIVRRRMAFDDDPAGYFESMRDVTHDLVLMLKGARDRVKSVQVSDELRLAVAERAVELKLEGVRAELAVLRTARCAAAWRGVEEVELRDVTEAWELCLGHRRPNQDMPETRKPKGTTPSEPNREKPSLSSMPIEPKAARSDEIPLRASVEKIDEELLNWWREPVTKNALNLGPISWMGSLVSSFQNGWNGRDAGLILQRRKPNPRRNLWCFLDASRSTGASQLISGARDALRGLALAVKSVRFNLLILDNAGTRWLARKSSGRRLKAMLDEMKSAGGKSLIGPALRMLHRERLRSRPNRRDYVLICSDGLATPMPGQNAGETWRYLAEQVRQISRTGTRIAWLHPAPKRGLSEVLNRICGSAPVRKIQIL